MMIALISLCWLVIGALIGALANAAKLRPARWGRRGWPVMLGLGALVALLGGWVGAALLGFTFGWPSAVWCAALGVALLPRLITWGVARQR